jgi:molecular chaperone HscB
MDTPPRVVTIHACKHCGTGAPLDAHFCPQCDKILSLARHGDYFVFFGLPRKLLVDPKDLEQRLRTLSRQFHPDFFYNATAPERLASLERSSYLNDAYRALRDPVARVEYLLQVEGISVKGKDQAGRQAPADLLEEVFALNEELDEIRAALASGAAPDTLQPRIARARAPIERKRREHDRKLQALMERWDRQVDAGVPAETRRETLEALRQWVLEQSYIENLLASVQQIAATA